MKTKRMCKRIVSTVVVMVMVLGLGLTAYGADNSSSFEAEDKQSKSYILTDKTYNSPYSDSDYTVKISDTTDSTDLPLRLAQMSLDALSVLILPIAGWAPVANVLASALLSRAGTEVGNINRIYMRVRVYAYKNDTWAWRRYQVIVYSDPGRTNQISQDIYYVHQQIV